MKRITHICVGIAITLPIINVIPLYSVLGLLGATFPDIDIFIPKAHRKLTHSFIGLIAFTLLVMQIDKYVAIVFSINYLTHIILDSFTKMGVPLFYPYKRYYGAKIIKTGSAEDYIICLIALHLITSQL